MLDFFSIDGHGQLLYMHVAYMEVGNRFIEPSILAVSARVLMSDLLQSNSEGPVDLQVKSTASADG